MSDHRVYFDLLTPVSFLARSAIVYRDEIAVVHGDKRITYREFHVRVNRLASALINIGIGKGDKVAFICANIPPMLEAHFAIPMIGAALVPINVRLSGPEISYIVRHSESKALFVDNEFADLVRPILDELTQVETVVNICDISPERPLKGMEYEELLATGSSAVECRVEDEYDVASINYTSGTTGKPKGVMIHHRGAYLNSLGEALELGMDSRSVYLWTLPMFHCNGWCFPWAVVAVGGVQVCLRRVAPERIFELVEKEGVTHMCGAPTVLISMTSHPAARDFRVNHRFNVVTAAAPPAPKVIQDMEAMGANVVHVYGLTEVYGPHSICAWQKKWDQLPSEETAEIKARQGVAYLTAMHMDVVDPETMEPVPRDGKTVGEIVMRGNNVMLGYYKQPDATEEAFRGGWFHSGDLAVVHPDGYVKIQDRMKDIIISGGENISGVEVESVLYRHPDVQEAAVIGIPHPKWGEVVKAFVTPKPGANPDAQEIINFCKDRIARFKAPKSIEFCELPKTSTGKIKKFELRKRA